MQHDCTARPEAMRILSTCSEDAWCSQAGAMRHSEKCRIAPPITEWSQISARREREWRRAGTSKYASETTKRPALAGFL